MLPHPPPCPESRQPRPPCTTHPLGQWAAQPAVVSTYASKITYSCDDPQPPQDDPGARAAAAAHRDNPLVLDGARDVCVCVRRHRRGPQPSWRGLLLGIWGSRGRVWWQCRGQGWLCQAFCLGLADHPLFMACKHLRRLDPGSSILPDTNWSKIPNAQNSTWQQAAASLSLPSASCAQTVRSSPAYIHTQGGVSLSQHTNVFPQKRGACLPARLSVDVDRSDDGVLVVKQRLCSDKPAARPCSKASCRACPQHHALSCSMAGVQAVWRSLHRRVCTRAKMLRPCASAPPSLKPTASDRSRGFWSNQRPPRRWGARQAGRRAAA